jgi:hypothetical protein
LISSPVHRRSEDSIDTQYGRAHDADDLLMS